MQQDKRTIKTEMAIHSAFLTLLRRKEIGQITVNDICEKALISRNTFYSHYADKYLLMETLSKKFINGLLDQIIAKNMLNSYQSAVNTTAWLFFDYLNDHQDMVKLLSRNDPQFWTTFTSDTQAFMLSFSGENERSKVFITYTTNALTGCFQEYFEGRLVMPPADFIKYLIEIAARANEFMLNS